MSEIIDCEDIYCAECEVRIVKPPRRKYCSEECAKVAQRKRDADYRKKKRGKGVVASSVASLSIIDKSIDKPSTNAIVPTNPQLTELRAFSAEYLEPVLFSFVQQFQAFTKEVRELLEDKNQAVDELLFVMVQDPDFRKQLVAREKQVHQAMKLIQELGASHAPFKIRRVLQSLEGLSKRTAEEIMLEAEKRLRNQRDRNQRSMEDYS